MSIQPAHNPPDVAVPAAFQAAASPDGTVRPADLQPPVVPLPPVFRVPESEASRPENQFRFTMPDDPDTVISVPLLKYLPPALAERLAQEDGLGTLHAVFDWVDPTLWDRFTDSTQLEAMFEAWGKQSDIQVGESEASSVS